MMQLPGLFRTSTFRLTALFSALFACSTLLLFAFIYWQTSIVEVQRVDRSLALNAEIIAQTTNSEITHTVETRDSADLRQIAYVALFDPERRFIAGNLTNFP